MNNFSKFNHLIINSKEDYILFKLGTHGEIKYCFLDKSYEPMEIQELYKGGVLKYSVTIDKKDKIHLIALMKSGELIYSIYHEGNWSNTTIAKFDFRSNIFNNIKIISEEGNVHIIYDFANLINSKLRTIQHVVGNNTNWKQHNITKFVSDRVSNPFTIDLDSFGTIHLLYRSLEGDISQIYHTFYNPYSDKWNTTPQKLTTSNTNKLYPYIFVDTKNNLHGLWLEEINNNYVLKYSKVDSSRMQKYIWKHIKIPYIEKCNNMPIMLEEKDTLKIIYSIIDGIGYLYSLDRGDTWSKGEISNIGSSNINLIRISNSIFETNIIKINDTYYSMDKGLEFYFLDNFNSSSSTAANKPFFDIEDELEQSRILQDIEEISIKIAQLAESHDEIKNTLNQTLASQNKIEKKISYILEILETKKNSIFDKFFK
ncbi:MAG: hypothetical protein GXY88_03695 [Tissierellia bacterium]|nr:hypothetical protein [Tissierellia bacterium]